MMKLTKTGIGLLTRLYRSVLRKCWLINVGLFSIVTLFPSLAAAKILVRTDNTSDLSYIYYNQEYTWEQLYHIYHGSSEYFYFKNSIEAGGEQNYVPIYLKGTTSIKKLYFIEKYTYQENIVWNSISQKVIDDIDSTESLIALDQAIGNWKNGVYIKNSLPQEAIADNQKYFTVGQALTALDTGLLQINNALYTNYYMKNNKKYKKLDIFIT